MSMSPTPPPIPPTSRPFATPPPLPPRDGAPSQSGAPGTEEKAPPPVPPPLPAAPPQNQLSQNTPLGDTPSADDVAWPAPEKSYRAIPPEVQNAPDEYHLDVKKIMSTYAGKDISKAEVKDYRKWNDLPHTEIVLLSLFLSLGIFAIIAVIYSHLVTLWHAIIATKDTIYGDSTDLTNDEFLAFLTTLTTTQVLWLGFAVVLMYAHVKALWGTYAGTLGALGWVRGVGVFWLAVSFTAVLYLPAVIQAHFLTAVIVYGGFVVGCGSIGMSFTPRIREWVKR